MKKDLDGVLARLQWLTLVEIAFLVIGGGLAILTGEPWPALIGLAAAFLFSRFVTSKPTKAAEQLTREEFED